MFFSLSTLFLSCCLTAAALTTRPLDEGQENFIPSSQSQLVRSSTVIYPNRPIRFSDGSRLITPPGRVEDQQRSVQDVLAIDDGSQTTFPDREEYIIVDGHNASLGRYMWSGRTGQYYEVSGGWPGWEGDIVAKEFYIWHWPHEFSREAGYLSRVGQFVASDKYKGVQWLIMYKPPGVHLTKTRAFKTAYQKGRKECDDLVERAYEPAFNAIIDYIRNYGIYHQVSNSRMLWDETVENVSIFDLGDDVERDPNDAGDQNLRNEVALNVYKAWPNDGIYSQDWCVNGQGQ